MHQGATQIFVTSLWLVGFPFARDHHISYCPSLRSDDLYSDILQRMVEFLRLLDIISHRQNKVRCFILSWLKYNVHYFLAV